MNKVEALQWLEDNHTLHWSVEFLYVVEGYVLQFTYDDYPMGDKIFGETLFDCIVAASKVDKSKLTASKDNYYE